MIIWAIVPVKPLRRGKSRLAKIFPAETRSALNRKLLQHTLEVLQSLPEIEQTLVISRDPEALALARKLNARSLNEEGEPQLNTALTRATVLARLTNTSAVLVLPADLPQLNPGDLQAMIARAKDPPVVVVAPDRHESGTNALLVYPAGLIEYSFGKNSFQAHCQRAREAGARLEIVRLPSLQLDLDTPDDIRLLDAEILQALTVRQDNTSHHPGKNQNA